MRVRVIAVETIIKTIDRALTPIEGERLKVGEWIEFECDLVEVEVGGHHNDNAIQLREEDEHGGQVVVSGVRWTRT
jgi:hypothetical protein